jgi:hypothetical protein
MHLLKGQSEHVEDHPIKFSMPYIPLRGKIYGDNSDNNNAI